MKSIQGKYDQSRVKTSTAILKAMITIKMTARNIRIRASGPVITLLK
ncbi:MAG TPA: hypothetical protein VGD65_07865 [Chryseosolibacter sp.]